MKKTVFILLLLLSALSFVSCSLFSNDSAEEPSEDEEADLGIWHYGYVGAESDPDYPFEICDGDEEYLYSDVIELGNRGTKITLSVKNPPFDIKEVLTLSFWERSGDGWVLFENAPHVVSTENSLIKREESEIAIIATSRR